MLPSKLRVTPTSLPSLIVALPRQIPRLSFDAVSKQVRLPELVCEYSINDCDQAAMFNALRLRPRVTYPVLRWAEYFGLGAVCDSAVPKSAMPRNGQLGARYRNVSRIVH